MEPEPCYDRARISETARGQARTEGRAEKAGAEAGDRHEDGPNWGSGDRQSIGRGAETMAAAGRAREHSHTDARPDGGHEDEESHGSEGEQKTGREWPRTASEPRGADGLTRTQMSQAKDPERRLGRGRKETRRGCSLRAFVLLCGCVFGAG